jgi:hypothetical protein
MAAPLFGRDCVWRVTASVELIGWSPFADMRTQIEGAALRCYFSLGKTVAIAAERPLASRRASFFIRKPVALKAKPAGASLRFLQGSVLRQGPDRHHQGIAVRPQRRWKATLPVFQGRSHMPIHSRLIYQYAKLVIFLAVWIALAWSIWRLLS